MAHTHGNRFGYPQRRNDDADRGLTAAGRGRCRAGRTCRAERSSRSTRHTHGTSIVMLDCEWPIMRAGRATMGVERCDRDRQEEPDEAREVHPQPLRNQEQYEAGEHRDPDLTQIVFRTWSGGRASNSSRGPGSSPPAGRLNGLAALHMWIRTGSRSRRKRLADTVALLFDPDPASKSSISARLIGYSTTVATVRDDPGAAAGRGLWPMRRRCRCCTSAGRCCRLAIRWLVRRGSHGASADQVLTDARLADQSVGEEVSVLTEHFFDGELEVSHVA